jgi:ubiquinone/menaquinone biosynthesis C-methylase UbiE
MQHNQSAYNQWAEQYDTNHNRTRDLEGRALRHTLAELPFRRVLEVGCGTGKNSAWFVQHAEEVLAVDFSEAMMARAKAKVQAPNIRFAQADITQPWTFSDAQFDLIAFSLVLEHIQDIDFVFAQLRPKLAPGGQVYIGELHPFKQYLGSLARFDTDAGRVLLDCYPHHVSEFVQTAQKHGLSLQNLTEWWDDEAEQGTPPRILAMRFF